MFKTLHTLRVYVLSLLLLGGIAMCQESIKTLDTVFYETSFNGSWGRDMPLEQVLQVLARVVGYEAVVSGVTGITVNPPLVISSSGGLVDIYASLYNLCAYNQDNFLVIQPSSGTCQRNNELLPNPVVVAAGVNVAESVGSGLSTTSQDVSVTSEPFEPKQSYKLTFTVLLLNQQKAVSLGIDWQNFISTASELVLGYKYISSGYFPRPEFEKLLSFLEQEGVSSRRDDLDLYTFDGQEVTYNRGGSLNVSLVSAGQENIDKSLQYGLIVTVTPEMQDDNILLKYSYSDIDTGSIQDASLINLASITTSSSIYIPCDSSTVLTSFTSKRDDIQGSGLPAFSEIPLAGFLAGQASQTIQKNAYIVGLSVVCLDGDL